MTVAERQDQLIANYLSLEDAHERFQTIVETAALGREAIDEAGRCEANLVPGCVSRTWLLVGRLASGQCSVQIESESPALNAIGALICQIYDNAPDEQIISVEPLFLQKLSIDRHLTPTRQRGLRNLRRLMVEKVLALSEREQKFP